MLANLNSRKPILSKMGMPSFFCFEYKADLAIVKPLPIFDLIENLI